MTAPSTPKSASDSLAVSDARTTAASLIVVESSAATDLSALARSSAVSDTVTATDARTSGASSDLVDVGTVSDTSSLARASAVSDTLGATDSAVVSTLSAITVTDAVAITDVASQSVVSVVQNLASTVFEEFAVTETETTTDDSNPEIISVVDQGALSSSSVTSEIVTLSETSSIVANYSTSENSAITEQSSTMATASGSDSFLISVEASGSGGSSQSGADSIIIDDRSSGLDRAMNDVFIATDSSLAVNRVTTTTDSLSVTDLPGTTLQDNVVPRVDSAVATDLSSAIANTSAFDSVAVVDSSQVSLIHNRTENGSVSEATSVSSNITSSDSFISTESAQLISGGVGSFSPSDSIFIFEGSSVELNAQFFDNASVQDTSITEVNEIIFDSISAGEENPFIDSFGSIFDSVEMNETAMLETIFEVSDEIETSDGMLKLEFQEAAPFTPSRPIKPGSIRRPRTGTIRRDW
jgi:hypothetical protein